MAHFSNFPSSPNSRDPREDPTIEKQHLENQRRARRLLARMERMEEHAQKALGEIPLPEPNLPERDVKFYRGMYATSYRRLVGVEPADRALLRNQLELVEQTGSQAIEQIVDSVRESLQAQRILDTSESPLA
jgi:hypothetical protein